MPKPTRIEINCETGEVLEIELTDAEIAEMETLSAKIATDRAEQDAKIAALNVLKESAKAKLVAGEPLTEEEASTIVL